MASLRRIAALSLIALTAFTASASAQPIKAATKGEHIVVKQTTTGEELRGRLIELSPDTLSLLVKDRQVDLPLNNVLRIDSTHDSVLNGAAIGAAILGGMCAISCGQGLASLDDLPKAILASAGWGALFGAIVDARREGRHPIYIKPTGTRGSALQVRLRF
jgi:hypothetical protein